MHGTCVHLCRDTSATAYNKVFCQYEHGCNAVASSQDVDGYKSTTYYTDRGETGFNLTGMNTSSSVENIQAMDK